MALCRVGMGIRAGALVALVSLFSGMAVAGAAAADQDGNSDDSPVDPRPDPDRFLRAAPMEPPSFGHLGGIGLLETRTARFLPDGEVAIGASYADPLARYFLTWQATPWLEATARYAEARGEPGDLGRALDLKFRLVSESHLFPAIAVGFQDALGGGETSGEYIVFSKQTNAFDVTFGLGWGQPASRGGTGSPFDWISGSFNRRTANTGSSGLPALGNYFSGRMGVFGGVEYITPLRGLTIKAEYNGSDARTLDLADPITRDFPVNVGVNYRPVPWLNLAAGFVRGDTLSLGLTLRANVHEVAGIGKSRDPQPITETRPDEANGPVATVRPSGGPVSVVVPSPADPVDRGRLTAAVVGALHDAGIDDARVEVGEHTASVVLSVPASQARTPIFRAAYATLSALPARYDAVSVRNRHDTVTREPGQGDQRFTRSMVESMARVDAAFDDLMDAGGVSSVDSDGDNLTVGLATTDGRVTRAPAMAAVTDLMQGADAIEFQGPINRERRTDVDAMRRDRRDAHIARFLRDRDFQLKSVSATDDTYDITVIGNRRFDDRDVSDVLDGVRAIIAATSEPAAVTLSVMRGGMEVARTSWPEASKPDTVQGKGADHTPPGMRRMPLYGLVRWDKEDGSEEDKHPRKGVAPDVAPEHPVEPEAGPPSAHGTASLTREETERLKTHVRSQGLRPLGWRMVDDRVEVAVDDDRFGAPAMVIGRSARALNAVVPGDVDGIGVTTVERGVTLSSVRMLRTDVDAALKHAGSPEEIWLNTDIEKGDAPAAKQDWTRFGGVYPSFAWAFYPEVRQHFGNGEDGGYRAEVYATLAGEVEVMRGLTLSGAVTRDIAGNLDGVPAGPGVDTPRVRSDIARYVDEGKTAIARAMADYTARLLPDLYVRASAGLFEPMYGGAGLEVLYRPQAKNYAVGLDLNRVKQRDFDQILDFRDYSAWTGHVRFYRDWSHLGLEAVVEAGRYLAGDWGGGVDVYRRFDNGVRLGAWFTMTDMARSEFGRDRFAKGLYLSVPLDLVLPFSLRREVDVEARALNRDGGQRLDRGPGLYETTRPGTARAIRGDWRNLLD